MSHSSLVENLAFRFKNAGMLFPNVCVDVLGLLVFHFPIISISLLITSLSLNSFYSHITCRSCD